MIPILYTPFETDFTSNGIGRLTDCISCTVTEERNGIFECEFEYPITGKFYDYLINNPCYVGVIHDDHHDIQPFELYRHSDPIDGIVTFNAHHISYNLANVIVENITADTCADALDKLATESITGNPFSFWTDKATSGTFKVTAPDNVRALLSGQQGSILDVYGGGEYEFDKHLVRLYANRGQDRGVTIRYGKNLTDIDRTYDAGSVFNTVVPFWADEEGNTVTLPEGYIAESTDTASYPWEDEINGQVMEDGNGNVIEFNHFVMHASALDLSSEFEEQPSVADLRAAAIAYMTNNQPWLPDDNISVNFVQLWETPEYENVAALQRVSLCDTVSVYYPEMQIAASAKVIRIVYNVLTERYDEMELGNAKATLAGTIKSDLSSQIAQATVDSRSFTERAIANATSMITGGLGGYVVMNLNADGQPQEILIMDTDDINTAVNVIRMNKNGIGFSTNGYEGPFTSAWTIDGAFNADFITSGTLLANFIQGGTLTLGGLNNNRGVLVMLDGSGEEKGRWNNSGIRLPMSDSDTDYASFSKTGFKLYMQNKGSIGSTIVYSSGSGSDYHYPPSGQIFGLIGSLFSADQTEYWHFTLLPSEFEIGRSTGNNGSYQTAQHMRYAADGFSLIDEDDGRYLHWSNAPTLDMLSLSGNISTEQFVFCGGISVSGTKSRVVTTKEYGTRLLYCYETPSPMFGDIGEGTTDETGVCYVFLDPVFAETISTKQYQVTLQKYGEGDLWISERKAGYFVVRGTPDLSFGWEIKAKQFDCGDTRMARQDETTAERIDYGKLASKYLSELREGRIYE